MVCGRGWVSGLRPCTLPERDRAELGPRTEGGVRTGAGASLGLLGRPQMGGRSWWAGGPCSRQAEWMPRMLLMHRQARASRWDVCCQHAEDDVLQGMRSGLGWDTRGEGEEKPRDSFTGAKGKQLSWEEGSGGSRACTEGPKLQTVAVSRGICEDNCAAAHGGDSRNRPRAGSSHPASLA